MTDLRSYVERIERLREEKRAITDDERDIFTEVKHSGYDGKALRKVLQRRAMGDAAVAELDAIVDAYEAALGGKRVAAEALKAGASVRQAAKAGGISVGAAHVQKTKISEPDRAATSSAPAGGGGEGDPAAADSIPPSAAGAAGHEDVLAAPLPEPPAPCADPPTPAADTVDPERGEARLITPHGAELCIGPNCPACATMRSFKPADDDALLAALNPPAFLRRRA